MRWFETDPTGMTQNMLRQKALGYAWHDHIINRTDGYPITRQQAIQQLMEYFSEIIQTGISDDACRKMAEKAVDDFYPVWKSDEEHMMDDNRHVIRTDPMAGEK